MMTVSQIWEELTSHWDGQAPPYVVLTGGNPAMQPHLGDLMRVRPGQSRWSIETQGSVWHSWIADCDRIVLSPKLKSANQVQTPETFEAFLNNIWRADRKKLVSIKVVVFERSDVREAIDGYFEVGRRLGVQEFVLSVGTIAGDTSELVLARYRDIVEDVKHYKTALQPFPVVRVTPQNHVLLWGHERGV